MIESQLDMSTQTIQFERKSPKKLKNPIKDRWSIAEIEALYDLPFSDLMFQAPKHSTSLKVKSPSTVV